jgi:hypothetical protein
MFAVLFGIPANYLAEAFFFDFSKHSGFPPMILLVVGGA